jgi:hypothetical protein
MVVCKDKELQDNWSLERNVGQGKITGKRLNQSIVLQKNVGQGKITAIVL